MSQYFSLLICTGINNDELHSEEHQSLIVNAMHEFFMEGQTYGPVKLVEDFSVNAQYDQFYEIFNGLELLYQCETYGDVKYIPTDKKVEFYEKSKALLVEYLKDVDSLLKNGVSELEYLLSFINVLERNLNSESHILFNIS